MASRFLYRVRRLLSYHKDIYVYTDKASNPVKIFFKNIYRKKLAFVYTRIYL